MPDIHGNMYVIIEVPESDPEVRFDLQCYNGLGDWKKGTYHIPYTEME